MNDNDNTQFILHELGNMRAAITRLAAVVIVCAIDIVAAIWSTGTTVVALFFLGAFLAACLVAAAIGSTARRTIKRQAKKIASANVRVVCLRRLAYCSLLTAHC